MRRDPLIVHSPCGLFCPPGNFYIDAWRGVGRNVVTHAHSDHARGGSERYLAAADGAALLRQRLGNITLDAVEYGESLDLNGVKVSLHPAGHVRGSAQVRVEHRGEVWGVSGDYKRQPDPTCRPFELVRCHTFITECTFGLPIFRWNDPAQVTGQINRWWRANRDAGRTSILLAYSLGKAQRVLAGLDETIGPVLLHGAVHAVTEAYRQAGAMLPPAEYASAENARLHKGRAMVVAPPGAISTTWARKFAPFVTAMASGWMRVRGFRRRQGTDRGFVLSDHVDFPALMQTIRQTEAEHVIATHGYTDALVRLLSEGGLRASAIKTRFTGEEEEAETDPAEKAVMEGSPPEKCEDAGGNATPVDVARVDVADGDAAAANAAGGGDGAGELDFGAQAFGPDTLSHDALRRDALSGDALTRDALSGDGVRGKGLDRGGSE
jgi:putative mRNA 3-end processing factor